MAEVDALAALNALIPGLSVTTVIVVALVALINGKVIRRGEHDAIIERYKSEHTAVTDQLKETLTEVRAQRDKYEGALWELADVAKIQARATEKLTRPTT